MKKVFPRGAKEAHHDIWRGGHRNPYQLENAKKLVGQSFASITWDNILHGAVEGEV